MSLLGSGGMGAVYLAKHPEIGRRVAIKVLPMTLAQQSRIVERFLTEARAVVKIEHRNLIDIYDFGRTDDGQLYYVMEVLRGCELTSVMAQQGTMSPAEILPYLEQICAGLQAAHDGGVVHRDLKPENIFVLEGDKLFIKLLDFGIAKLLEPEERGATLTATGMVLGTPVYIAPEQAAGQKDKISARTDIYSLGVILFYMLAGKPPFTADSVPQLLVMHIQEPPPPLQSVVPAVPPGVARVVDQCLNKDPAERPPSAVALLDEFQRALGISLPAVNSRGASDGASTVPSPGVAVPPTIQASSPSPSQGGYLSTLSAAAGEEGLDPGPPPLAPFRRKFPVMALTVVLAAVVAASVGLVIRARRGPEPGPPAVSAPISQAEGRKPDSPVLPAGEKINRIFEASGDPAVPEKCLPGDKRLLAVLEKAATLLKGGKYKTNRDQDREARRLLQGMRKDNPDNAVYWTLMARATFFMGGSAADVIADGKIAQRRCPQWPVPHNLVGSAHFTVGNDKEAEVAYRAALRLEPRYAVTRFNLALISLKARRHEEVVALVTRLLQDRPNHRNAHLVRAQAHLLAGRLKEARADLDQTLTRAPDNANAHLLAGQVFIKQGLVEEAQRSFCRAKTLGHPAGGKLCPSTTRTEGPR